MRDVATWSSLSQEQRDDRTGALHENERTVTGSLQLANETMSMLCYLTSNNTIAACFANSSLCGSLAAMLLDLLRKLAGRRGIELKVDAPEKYHFRPKIMLVETVRTFLHMESEVLFLRAAASDGHYTKAGGEVYVVVVFIPSILYQDTHFYNNTDTSRGQSRYFALIILWKVMRSRDFNKSH